MSDPSDQPKAAPPARSLRTRITHEFQRFLILFLYLWALLGLFVLNEDLIERSAGDAFLFQGFAVLNAFILAKVMLAAEHLDVGRWLEKSRQIQWDYKNIVKRKGELIRIVQSGPDSA